METLQALQGVQFATSALKQLASKPHIKALMMAAVNSPRALVLRVASTGAGSASAAELAAGHADALTTPQASVVKSLAPLALAPAYLLDRLAADAPPCGTDASAACSCARLVDALPGLVMRAARAPLRASTIA